MNTHDLLVKLGFELCYELVYNSCTTMYGTLLQIGALNSVYTTESSAHIKF